MKNKFLYVTTGLLTIVVIGVMFLSPQLYFAYEDWTDHNITTTEEANLNNRNRNITVARKLQLYEQYKMQQICLSKKLMRITKHSQHMKELLEGQQVRAYVRQ